METHRLKQLAEALDISVNQLEKEVGVGVSTFSKAIQRSSKINKGIALRIVEKYPNVSKTWLLTGKGDMFTDLADSTVHDGGAEYKSPGNLLALAAKLFSRIPNPMGSDVEVLSQIKQQIEEIEQWRNEDKHKNSD